MKWKSQIDQKKSEKNKLMLDRDKQPPKSNYYYVNILFSTVIANSISKCKEARLANVCIF